MASSKEMQLRAKIAKIAAKSAQIKHKMPVSTFGDMQALVMTPEVEADKALRNCKADPMPCATCCNAEDLRRISSKFPNNDAGWFTALVTHHADGKIRASKEGRDALGDFRVVKFNNKYSLLSAYCSWDYAVEHYKKVNENFEFAVVSFSTPEHLQTLCENPANY